MKNANLLDERLKTTSRLSLWFPPWLWQVFFVCVRFGEWRCIHCLCAQSRGKSETGPRASPRVMQAACFRTVGANALWASPSVLGMSVLIFPVWHRGTNNPKTLIPILLHLKGLVPKTYSLKLSSPEHFTKMDVGLSSLSNALSRRQMGKCGVFWKILTHSDGVICLQIKSQQFKLHLVLTKCRLLVQGI